MNLPKEEEEENLRESKIEFDAHLSSNRQSTNCLEDSFLKNSKHSRKKPLRSTKSESRSEFLSILSHRKERRAAAKAREENEKKKIMDRWLEEERKEREKRLRELLQRLATKKPSASEQQQKNIEDKIMERIERVKQRREAEISWRRSQSPTLKHHEHVSKKLEKLEGKIEENRENYIKKIERIKKACTDRKNRIETKLQLHKETRERRILRAKIHTTLEREAGIVCEKHQRDSQRVSAILDPKGEKKSTNTSVTRLVPDEILIEKFNDEELKQIREDPNYYIPLQEHRERVTLFEKTDQKHPTYNLSTVETFKKLRSPKLDLKTLQKPYKDWLQRVNSPHNIDPWLKHNNKLAAIELMKQRQAENYEFEKQKLEMWQETLLKRIEDKHILAKAGVETLINRRKEGIAGMDQKKALLMREGIIKSMKDKIKSEYLETYLTEIKSEQVSPRNTNEGLTTENTKDSPWPYTQKIKRKNMTPRTGLVRIKDYDERKDIFAKREFSRKLRQIRLLQQGMNKKLERASLSIAKYQHQQQDL